MTPEQKQKQGCRVQTKCPGCGKKLESHFPDLGYKPTHFRFWCDKCGTTFTNSYPEDRPPIQMRWENGEDLP